jgi:hypothetical protein
MEAYQGYFENGHVIPMGNPRIPEGSEVIITVLDQPFGMMSRAERQKKARNEIWNDLADCEPLGAEFDEIMNQGFKITRELDL